MIVAGDRDPALLHRLEQGRLGPRAGAVDLVRHQELAEHRTGDEAERPAAGLVLLQHLGPQDVGRHQVRGTLHALVVEPQHDAQRLDQAGLGEAGDADQQDVPAREQGDQGQVDDVLLAEDDAADPVPHHGQAAAQRLDFGQQLGRILDPGRPVAHCIGSGQIRDLLCSQDNRPRKPGPKPVWRDARSYSGYRT